ncbi:MAG TPA: aromatic ring-hydroxylating dioxygenase subunit alpha [Puia sp.]|jgi:choline monooxygenase|nr:aromatic ring-hydroxylating dioxygenase subunit alpha [Puia sp.]
MPRFIIHPDITLARTPHPDLYTDPAVFQLCKERLFTPSWQFIGDTDMVPAPGDAYPFTLLETFLDEPLALVRDNSGTIRLLSNVCTHRGNIVVDQPCRLTHLRCRYHGRHFNLDGSFRSMPEFKEVQEFPSPADDLHPLPLTRWGKWLFTSLGDAPSSGSTPARPSVSAPRHADFWQEIMQRLSWLPFDKYVLHPEYTRDFIVEAHWALYCENYLEGFHIPFVHAGLNAVIDFGNYTTELFRYSSLQLGIAKEDEDCFDLPPDSPDYGKKVAAYYFFIFPNTMFNFYPWGLSVNIVKPLGLHQTKITFLTYIADPDRYDKGAGSGLDTVEMEDEEVVEAVQKGVRSRFYTHGRYSVTREQGTHHFHRIIADLLG